MKRKLKHYRSSRAHTIKHPHKKKKMIEPNISLTRQWLPNLTPLPTPTAIPITILSYNILAPSNISHTLPLYSHPDHLAWSRRLPMIQAELSHINADIMCLQEVDDIDHKKLVPPGFDVFLFRMTSIYKDSAEGQMTLWRKGMFKIVEQHDLLMNFDRLNSLYKNSQVCPIVVLRLLHKNKSSAKTTYFIVANAHISYNVERGDKKLAQTTFIVEAVSQIEKYLTQLGNKTVCVFCGDFNSTPSSAVFKLLTKGAYDCSTLPLGKLSGQLDTIIPTEVSDKEWYKETINKCSHWNSITKAPYEIVERLPLWYMTIKNTYVDYDIIKRTLIAKYKVELPLIYSFYERRTIASAIEKRRIREIFCNSMEEVEKLESIDESKSQDLFSYILESPIVFKSAYSEVFKGVCKYIRSYISTSKTLPQYEPVKNIKEVKEKVGTKFNDVELNYENWEETEKFLEGHTYESGYSHWVDRMLKCDYVFYSGEGMVPVKVYEIPEYQKIVDLGNICPNECVPSDHLPVATMFYYNPN